MYGYKVYERRDLRIAEIAGDKCIVTSCDSCGGVGEKEYDRLYALSAAVGAYTTRVALMEVLSAGAVVISVSNTVCCEMNPTGAMIIEGVKAEMKRAGIAGCVLNGSTEENFETGMTAVGISVVGIADKDKLRFKACSEGDLIVLTGRPLVGGELLEDNGVRIADYGDITLLLQNDDVREIVPVGSKGILYEAECLAKLNGMRFERADSGIDLKKSAGPSTCILAAVDCLWEPNVEDITVVGRLKRK